MPKYVARILNLAIDKAGLKDKGYSAKCFRPTGATQAIDMNMHPDRVRQIGRWKNHEVFEANYVHCKAPVVCFVFF